LPECVGVKQRVLMLAEAGTPDVSQDRLSKSGLKASPLASLCAQGLRFPPRKTSLNLFLNEVTTS